MRCSSLLLIFLQPQLSFLKWHGKLAEDCVEITVESRGGAADNHHQLYVWNYLSSFFNSRQLKSTFLNLTKLWNLQQEKAVKDQLCFQIFNSNGWIGNEMYVKVKNLKFKRSFGWLDYTGNLTYLPLEGWECTHVTIPFGRRCCPYGLLYAVKSHHQCNHAGSLRWPWMI